MHDLEQGLLDTRRPAYNGSQKVCSPPARGRKMPVNQKIKLALSQKGKKRSEKTRQLMSEIQKERWRKKKGELG